MAMSVNGLIADNDDNEDFLSHDGWNVFVELAENAGVFIIGRKTYEVVLEKYKDYGFKDVKADRIIVTSDESFDPPDQYHVVHSPEEAVKLAETLGHQNALLTGGATLNSAFMGADLINDVVLNVEPAIVGQGKPIFSSSNFAKRLLFESVDNRGDGILQLHYSVGENIV
jgi:dihydrofolate reductase